MSTQSDWKSLFYADWPLTSSLNPEEFTPEILYHYTGTVAAKGILLYKSLWATNSSFLNDPSEIEYGRKLIRKTIEHENELHREIKDVILREIETILSEIYVCCFTKLRDELSQWRAYGIPKTERYCIGFDLQKIHDFVDSTPQASFREVIYKEREQREEILRVIESAIKATKTAPAELEEIGKFAAGVLARLIPLLKSPAYAAEREWRIIRWIRTDDVSEVCFDAARGIVRPYVEFKSEQPLPVVKLIILAPGRESLSVKAANMLLQKAGIGDVQAEYSQVPFAE